MERATGLQFYYVIADPKVATQHIYKNYYKFENFNYLNVAFISYKVKVKVGVLRPVQQPAYHVELNAYTGGLGIEVTPVVT